MDITTTITEIMLTISNSLLYPVMITLILLVIGCLYFVGGLMAEYSVRGKNSEHIQNLKNEIKKIDNENENLISAEIEYILGNHEIVSLKKIETTRLLIKIGPGLGLMGTLIPLGPALIGLGHGNIETLATNLTMAFASTVLGLLIGSTAMIITSIRQRWYKKDLIDLQYFAEVYVENQKTDLKKEKEKKN